MTTVFNEQTGILSAFCSMEEIFCFHDADLPIDTPRAESGRALLEQLKELKQQHEYDGHSVKIHISIS